MVRVSVSTRKNGRAPGWTDFVSEMVTTAGETGVDIITDLVNQIIVEGGTPAE